MLQVRLELTTPASLTHTVYKYRALTNCATGARYPGWQKHHKSERRDFVVNPTDFLQNCEFILTAISVGKATGTIKSRGIFDI